MSAIEIPDKAHKVWKKIMKDGKPKNWVVFGVNKRFTKLKIQGSGEGGRAEALAELKDDKVNFGAFRVTGVDERGGVTSRRSKFVFFAWAGPNVPVMMRAKMNGCRGAVRGICSGAHLDLFCESAEDLCEAKIEGMLRTAAGAHQVNSYDWSNSQAAASATDKKGVKAAAKKAKQASAATAASVARRVGRKAARRASLILSKTVVGAAIAPDAEEVKKSEEKAAATPKKEKAWVAKKRVAESAGTGWSKEGMEDTFRLGAELVFLSCLMTFSPTIFTLLPFFLNTYRRFDWYRHPHYEAALEHGL